MVPFLEEIYMIHSKLQAQRKDLYFQSGYVLFQVKVLFSLLHEINTTFRAKMEMLKRKKKACNWNYENTDRTTK